MADHLAPGGVFVIEAFVPDLRLYEHGRRLSTSRILGDTVVLDAASIDEATQRVSARLLTVGDGSVSVYPIEIRYAWPSELDLMARLAGMRLRERWGGWSGEPFTSTSRAHVSLYELAG